MMTFSLYVLAIIAIVPSISSTQTPHQHPAIDASTPRHEVKLDDVLTFYDVRESSPVIVEKREQAMQSQTQQTRRKAASRNPNWSVSFDKTLGTPRFVHSHLNKLTEPRSDLISEAVIKNFVQEHRDVFQISATDLNQAPARTRNNHAGKSSHFWYQQKWNNIPVFGAELRGAVSPENELILIQSTFLPRPAQLPVFSGNISSLQQRLTALGATLTDKKLSGSEPTKVFFPMTAEEFRPAWLAYVHKEIFSYQVVVDAQNGDLLWSVTLAAFENPPKFGFLSMVNTSTNIPYESPSPYNPSNESPMNPTFDGYQPPYIPQQMWIPTINSEASPYGWVSTNTTKGNNVNVFTDWDLNFLPDASNPQPLANASNAAGQMVYFNYPADFDFDVAWWPQAPVINTFAVSNWYHDKFYELGFTPEWGNFQDVIPPGQSGAPNDRVNAFVQLGWLYGWYNNAAFNVAGPDGTPGSMYLFIFDGPAPDPQRDPAMDNQTLGHELTHSLSLRLHWAVLGSGLISSRARGMGEGWSDIFPFLLLGEGNPGVGNFTLAAHLMYNFYPNYLWSDNYFYGVRKFPFSADLSKNPVTFKDIDYTQYDVSGPTPVSPVFAETPWEVHHIGHVWGSILWDVLVELYSHHGDAARGILAQLLVDGMKISPLNPDFIEARDSILLADLVYHGGQYHCELWKGFKRRGLGFSAADTGTQDIPTGIQEANDLPSECSNEPPPLIGDLNGDGKVNGADLGIVLGDWGLSGPVPADLNQDDKVNGDDVNLLLQNWTG